MRLGECRCGPTYGLCGAKLIFSARQRFPSINHPESKPNHLYTIF